jgi:hypothetical protein
MQLFWYFQQQIVCEINGNDYLCLLLLIRPLIVAYFADFRLYQPNCNLAAIESG